MRAFTWEERKLIAAAAYHAEKLALAEKWGSLSGTQTLAVNVAAHAAHVAHSTAYNWINDYTNNKGHFLPSFWGAFPKLASVVGNISTKTWAHAWVINNMGHKTAKKNKVCRDFNEALHKYLGLVWDAKNPTICDGAARRLLKSTGARWTEVKQGNTHTDSHGKDHVVNGQRPAFLSLYLQLYLRGPNFLKVAGSFIDKDALIGTSDLYNCNKHLLDDPGCMGPRGLHMGGQVDPGRKNDILPFAKKIDFPGRIWILMCHDEACVHTLKGEGWCWLIPGVDMGDIPPKSDGEFEHLAELDAEHEGGCISLDGTVGQISRTQLHEYIKDKRAGQKVKVPRWASVRMHGGAGGEGYWLGDDSAMQFELIIDIFDVRYNMPWIADPTEATTEDLAAVTDAQRAVFPYGLAVQGDRSQGHLKMAADSTNANKLRKRSLPCTLVFACLFNDSVCLFIDSVFLISCDSVFRPGGKQPHFRHTFAPLPEGQMHWRQCRAALCSEYLPGTPPCEVCQIAVNKYGEDPNFQSIGRKGSHHILSEMGIQAKDLDAPEQIALIKTKENWKLANRKSQIQELFESRGHFFLVGVACHAELASKEHGWERLKRGVKPHVDGTLTTLRELIATTLQTITQRERLLDNARCRRVMHAYRKLAERGESATADSLQLWERVHSKHRDVHVGELAALQLEANISIPLQHQKVLDKMKSQAEMKKIGDKYWEACMKKWLSKKKSMQNDKYARKDYVKYKRDNKKRNETHDARVLAGEVHKEGSAYNPQSRRL